MHLTAFIINPFVLEMIANCLRIVKPPVRHISLRNKKAGRQCDNTLPAGDCFEKETCIFFQWIYSLERRAIVSMWLVWGNISTGWRAWTFQPWAVRYRRSRAWVSGLQEI